MAKSERTCGCDEARRLRSQRDMALCKAAADERIAFQALLDLQRCESAAKIVAAERDYMLGMLQPDDIRVMRQELAKQWEAQHLGALPEGERTDPDGIF